VSPRLTLALDTGDLVLPEDGTLSVLSPTPETNLTSLPRERVQIVQPFWPHYDHFQLSGFNCVTGASEACAAVIVCLPRAKAQARALVHAACVRSTGLVIVDGTKTDGIDSVFKDVRKRVDIGGQLTKAHGRIFWFNVQEDDFADWQAPQTQMADGYHTAPGVFSADAIDPASALLAKNLPKRLGRRVVDLGTGWGYLSAQMLAADPKIETLDLVEADNTALECARRNVTDPRARFHWADALDWKTSGLVDTVVMNPPFHTGRTADPSLGRGFIATAARILTPAGLLWMVANRHLPYEAALSEQFSDLQEVAGDSRFKVLRAARPVRARGVHSKSAGSHPTRTRRSRADR
jgi:16S rRNA (guanine1207-N2)-methyltransferase